MGYSSRLAVNKVKELVEGGYQVENALRVVSLELELWEHEITEVRKEVLKGK